MKTAILTLLMCAGLFAQNPPQAITTTTTVPSGPCTGNQGRLVGPGGTIYTCQNGTWAQVSGGGLPSGTGPVCVTSGVGSVCNALPNGTTATTQSPGDATTKLATDAFVAAAVAGGGIQKIYVATSYGMLCDNSTDDSVAFAALQATVYVAGGGVIWLPSICKIASPITLSNDSGPVPNQNYIRLTGPGSAGWATQQSTLPPCVAGLNLVYTGGFKLITLGAGILEIDHICIQDTATGDNSPGILTTNTTLNIHDTVFSFPTNNGSTVITLGGTTTSINGLTTGAFQGYGTAINHNFFFRGGRWVLFNAFANGVQVTNNSGLEGPSILPALFDLSSTFAPLIGNYISGNLVEVGNATTAFLCGASCNGNSFVGNQTYDPSGNPTSAYDLTGSAGNTVITSYDQVGSNGGWLQVRGVGQNTVIANPTSGTAAAVTALGPTTMTAPSGYAGDLLDLFVGASAKVIITNSGQITTASGANINLGGDFVTAQGRLINNSYLGANATSGMAHLSSGTVTVSTTSIGALSTGTSGYAIELSEQTCSGTCAGVWLGTVTNGTSFVINGAATDNSFVFWRITFLHN